MKISLHTAQKLLSEADDLWVEHQTAYYALSLGLTSDEAFFRSEYKDEEGLAFEYVAVGDDNITVELKGHTMTLMELVDDNL